MLAGKEIDILGNGGQLFLGAGLLLIGFGCLRAITRSEIKEWGDVEIGAGWFIFEFIRQFTIGIQHLSYLFAVICVPLLVQALSKGADIVEPMLTMAGVIAASFICWWIANAMDRFRIEKAKD
ncbi:MAG TPA: hypothetical protein VJZ77_09255 [Blastocatellia bacterium]|nr:hypothetical protein [Blastocatellia bacterium]